MLDSLKEITAAILDSYDRIGGINHLDGSNLPSGPAVARIIDDLRSLVFPGFRADEPVAGADVRFITAETVNRIARTLSSEMCRCFGDKARAEALAVKTLGRVPAMRQLARSDVEAAFAGDPAAKSMEEVVLAYPGLDAVIVHRFAHLLWTEGVPLLPRMMSEIVHGRTGIDIHPGAVIGGSFFIDHGTGVVIGETTIIGDRVKLYQGVTLGALSVSKDDSAAKRHPTIEDDVTIYSGATILGGGTVVGAGSVIGGNVWLVRSVPPNSRIYNSAGLSGVDHARS